MSYDLVFNTDDTCWYHCWYQKKGSTKWLMDKDVPNSRFKRESSFDAAQFFIDKNYLKSGDRVRVRLVYPKKSPYIYFDVRNIVIQIPLKASRIRIKANAK